MLNTDRTSSRLPASGSIRVDYAEGVMVAEEPDVIISYQVKLASL